MNLNKEFLSEIISYLISKGVTIHEVMDAYNARFEYEKPEVKPTLPQGDIDLLLCGRSVEENSMPCRKLKSKSGQMLFDVINGKTVIEHLKENGINYTNFDNRIRKKWTVEKACTTPLTKKVKPYTRVKKSKEPKAVIVPDNVKVVEESSPKTKMMLVNGRMTELEVSDTEKPAETLETQSNAENTAENVTNATELNGNNVTAVILDTPNPDAIHGEKDDYIEKALKKFITSTTGIEFEESKKDKKPKETKSDLTVLEVCQKMNVTTHELREMMNCGDFPQPDKGNKWSAKLLKEKGII